MDIVHLVARRSTCLRRQVGALLVKNKRILTTGYNGAPSGLPHCAEAGCLRERLQVQPGERHELCRGLHAEQNTILQAALHGVNIQGSTLYCTDQPCTLCVKMLINGGIGRMVWERGYPDDLASNFIREAGIEVRVRRDERS